MTNKFVKKLKPTLAVLAMGLSLGTQAAEVPLDRIVAIVNDGIILQSELDQRQQLISSRLSAQGTALPDENVLRKQVLERLILESIQRQVGTQRGIRISDSDLNSSLENIAARSNLTLAQFREALIAEGQDYNQARQQIRNEMLLQQIQQRLVNSRISISDQEIDNFLNSELGKQQIAASFNISQILIAVPTQATPEMIQRAEKHAKEIEAQLQSGADFAEIALAQSQGPNALKGGVIGWRKLKELPEQFATLVEPLNPGELSAITRSPSGFHILKVNDKRGGTVQMVKQAKVRHLLLKPNEIRSAGQTKLEIDNLYQRLQNGEPFAELAKQYSDDPGSGSEGGDLGWTQPGQMVPEFEQVMFSTPTGQYSAPFESRFGWHILLVEDLREQDLGEAMVVNQARATLRQRKFNEELQNWLREIRSQAYIELK